jgi:hypothetical protein
MGVQVTMPDRPARSVLDGSTFRTRDGVPNSGRSGRSAHFSDGDRPSRPGTPDQSESRPSRPFRGGRDGRAIGDEYRARIQRALAEFFKQQRKGKRRDEA